MKPIYKSLVLANMALAVTLSLQANVTSDGASTPQAVNAETLEGLKVTLVSPNVSGARDLIASGECVISNDKLQISIDGSKLAQGTTHRILVQMEYGTNTVVLYALNVTVPRYVTLASGTQEYADNVVVVSTFGDGADVPVVIDTEITENSQNPVTSAAIYAGLAGRQPAGTYADGTMYAEDGNGNAHITKPLGVGNGAASGDGAIASGLTDGENSYISANNAGAIASGLTNGDGSHIEASGDGAIASGIANGDGSYIEAGDTGTIASGLTDGENSYIRANSAGAIAIGRTDGDGSHIKTDSDGAIAIGRTSSTSGNVEATGIGSQAFGIGVQATQDGQMVCGQCNVVDEDDTFQMIVGNGADDEHRSNAFGVTKSGSLALFKADGTPIYLDAAKLEALIAMLPSA